MESTAEESSAENTTEDYWTGSGLSSDDEDSTHNETRELLAHEASDHEAVVYVSDGISASFVPVPSLKNQHVSPKLQAIQTLHGLQGLPSSSTADHSILEYDGTDITTEEDWRRHPESWDIDREHRRYRPNTTRVQHIEAECQDDYMKIRIGFNGSFNGLLYSAGYSYDPDCMYVNGTGRDYYEFFIQLNRCGTLGENTHHQDSRKNPTKNLMWNTVTVQYNPLIEEEFDEHFKVTCEYGYDFWKTVTFPFLDVEVATGNPVVFTLQPPECYMEIRYGYGTTGTRVAGPVRVGDPLTLIIYMRSKYDGFDIVVNDCYAHNGGNKRIQLIDQYGCPVDDKLISRFRGSWSESGLFETQVFAYMKTFRFTGSPALYIECDVRMCHGRCPSQPCHWRNSKSIIKRSIINIVESSSTPVASLSENVNLFQSLRVLQEGEADTELFQNVTTSSRSDTNDSNPDRVCLRPTLVNTFVGISCGVLCIMAATILAMCSRMRRVAREKLLSDSISYMTHKGRIN
ncbi:PREDICTED: uncharacterized protein LOC105361589 [Ceratosolen solmsi marchali]|uniref:Uncharacterized protein LOC105361589 n=1 Tax=Ceratosolen solmsi marchali TaxID=326594 RepID=A0AAJ6YFJ7_9HYME|nr:PREDICTED: uncharacterized protein LOC105361589 [Ceratosolen solmsi marchali]